MKEALSLSQSRLFEILTGSRDYFLKLNTPGAYVCGYSWRILIMDHFIIPSTNMS